MVYARKEDSLRSLCVPIAYAACLMRARLQGMMCV